MFYKLKAYLLYLKIKKDSSINISQHMNKTCYKTEFCEYFISYLWNKDSSIIKKDINIIKDFFATFYHFKEEDEKKIGKFYFSKISLANFRDFSGSLRDFLVISETL